MCSVENSWKFRLYLEENSEQQEKTELFMKIQYRKHGQETIYTYKTYIHSMHMNEMHGPECLKRRGEIFWP
jgi:hypothetical protein